MDPVLRMKELATQVLEHRRRYYVLDSPIISDTEYDRLERELRELEAQFPLLADPNSPTRRVGAAPVDFFPKVSHGTPMLSLENAYIPKVIRDAEDMKDWTDSAGWPDGWDAGVFEWLQRVDKDLRGAGYSEEIPDIHFIAELKVDGLSLALRYLGRRLVQAITRGDGETGEDVTENARTIADIPLELPEDAPERLEVRGEVFLSRRRWEELNCELDAVGQARFANPRNAASGTMKLLDSREVARRRLSFLPWQMLGEEDHEAAMDKLKLWGFNRMPATICGGFKEVLAFIRQQAEARHRLAFDTDGVVIKVKNLEIQHLLGATEHHPRWAVAFKYPALQATTEVKGITWQVGRTGKLTPVAELEAVEVAGSIVRRATLHNPDELERLGIRVGCRVFIEKGGDVIPKVVAVVPESLPSGAGKLFAPTECVACGVRVHGSRVVRTNSWFASKIRILKSQMLWTRIKWLLEQRGDFAKERRRSRRLFKRFVGVWCPNYECPAKLEARFAHFGGRSALDIEGLGDAVAVQLAQCGRFRHPWELLQILLDPSNGLAFLAHLDGFAEVSARNLFDAIGATRTKPLWRWIHAFGIPNVGEKAADLIANGFRSLESVWAADEFSVRAIETLGPGVGESLREFAELHSTLPAELSSYGVLPESPEGGKVPTIRLENWLSNVGIPELGPITARNLIQSLGGLEALWQADEATIRAHARDNIRRKKILDRDQEHIPSELVRFARAHPEIPRQLHSLGVRGGASSKESDDNLPFSGMTAVVTGTLPTLSREEAEMVLKRLGAKVAGSVSKKTTFVIVGEKAGPKKLDAINTYGIHVHDEQWLLIKAGSGNHEPSGSESSETGATDGL